jgi:hypothetical protein
MPKSVNREYVNDPYFQSAVKGLSDRTKQNYAQNLKRWQLFINTSPTEQISKRMHDLTSQNLTERMYFENQFRAFKEFLETNTDLKPLSILTELTAVASFFFLCFTSRVYSSNNSLLWILIHILYCISESYTHIKIQLEQHTMSYVRINQ